MKIAGQYSAILIATSPGTEQKVYAELKKFKDPFVGLKDINPIFGEYDLILEVDVPNKNALENYVIAIRRIQGIVETKTLSPNTGFWPSKQNLEDKVVKQ